MHKICQEKPKLDYYNKIYGDYFKNMGSQIFPQTIQYFEEVLKIYSDTLAYQKNNQYEKKYTDSTNYTPPTKTSNKIVINSLGMKFQYIPTGVFIMGCLRKNEPGCEKHERQRKIRISKDFYIQNTEVTQGQWMKVMGYNPSYFKKCGDQCPVERVSWNETISFINKLNDIEKTDKYRLPTEAEWEYACRAGSKTPFSFGKCLSRKYANYRGDHYPGCPQNTPIGIITGKTFPVASFLPNKLGLYDMHGNVYEWCLDIFDMLRYDICYNKQSNIANPLYHGKFVLNLSAFGDSA